MCFQIENSNSRWFNSWPNFISDRWVAHDFNLWVSSGHVFTHHPKKVTNAELPGANLFSTKYSKRITLRMVVLKALPFPSQQLLEVGLDTTFIGTQFGHRGTVGYLARSNKDDHVMSFTCSQPVIKSRLPRKTEFFNVVLFSGFP